MLLRFVKKRLVIEPFISKGSGIVLEGKREREKHKIEDTSSYTFQPLFKNYNSNYFQFRTLIE